MVEWDVDARGPLTLGSGTPVSPRLSAQWFRALYETPFLYSGILDPQGLLLDGNRLAIEGCGMVREEVIGRPFWECGWWSPDPRVAHRVHEWCRRAVLTGEPLRTRSRYFLADGTRRMVDLALSPVHGPDGETAFLVATGLDVSDFLDAQVERERRLGVETASMRELAEARTQELRLVRDAERRATERLRSLAVVGSELGDAHTVEDLTDIVINRGVPVLGADGGGIAVRTGSGLSLAVSDRLGDRGTVVYDRLPLDSPLPPAHVVRTGRPLVLPDRRAGLALTPEMAQVYEQTGRLAWAVAPLVLGRQVLGSLAVSWAQERRIGADEVGLIQAFAAQCAQALARIQVSVAEREATLEVQRVNESLQRSLLTRPPTPDCLEIAVRYLPAVRDAQVGGDWYDAFQLADGTTLVSVGDVAGHTGHAAATMAQLRNLLRGLAMESGDGAASLLTRLDRAVARLGLNALATAVVALVRTLPGGACEVRWASAGHLPPMVRRPDGRVRVLDGDQDLLLGLDAAVPRQERVVHLPVGSTLLLYTDGLVERRGESLDDGCDRLASALATAGSAAPEEVCDRLLGAVLEQAPDDDVAMLVLQPKLRPEHSAPSSA
jgi:PAS domain S-box-containing protein